MKKFAPKCLFCQTAALLSILSLAGCTTMAGKGAKEKREALELKKAHYQALHDAILTKTLETGISPREAVELYGKPDDVFSSGSYSGAFEIWSYEKVLTKEDPNWQPIRLYFNNYQLISWSY